MIEFGLDQVYAEVEDALNKKDLDKAKRYLWPALDQYPENAQLLFYASHVLVQEGNYLMAKLICEESLRLIPNGRAYGNLGAIYRRLNDNANAEKALNKAIEYEPDEKNAWNNKAANYVNEGNPHPGIAAAKRALELDPDFVKASWNLGLLYLEAGVFDQGWDHYRDGLALMDRMLRNYSTGTGDGPKLVESLEELKDYEKEHGQKPRCIVWGEQGIGDEIMFSTILEDFSQYAEIVFECHPRLLKLFQDSYPFIKEFYPTRKDDHIEWPLTAEKCPFKCPIGDLGKFLRRDRKSFSDAAKRQSPWLRADTAKVQEYREILEKIAGPNKHFIGVAWTGGVIKTMRWYRSCEFHQLWELANRDDVVLVSLQYEDDSAAVSDFYSKTGKMMLRFPSITSHFDYHHTLELVQALDEVVTVCQSVAHLSAAGGQVTRVLVPDKPAWRYGLEGTDWFWYGENAKLYRRKGVDWDDCILDLLVDVGVGPMPAHEFNLLKGRYHPDYKMLELGAKRVDRYKRWFERQGVNHVSVDLNGTGGSLALDLQKPLDLGEFDIVTNFGTTEHVDEQKPCWKNVVDSLRLGGTFVSTTPSIDHPGWAHHGRWYPTLEWYQKFCELNGLEIIECKAVADAFGRTMNALVARKMQKVPFAMPSKRLMAENTDERAKTGAYI